MIYYEQNKITVSIQTNSKSDTYTYTYPITPDSITTFNINCFATDTVNGLGIADEIKVRFVFCGKIFQKMIHLFKF